MTAAAAAPLRFMPKLTVIGKFLQRLVVTRWLDQRQHPLQYRVFYPRYVPDIKINWVQQMPQVQFRIVIETAAAKPLVAICNRPRNHISHCIVIKVQVERDRIVEANVFGINSIVLDHAKGECHDPCVLAPDEEQNLVRHLASNSAKVLLRQFLKMKLRFLVNLQVERVNVVNDRRDVVHDAHLDRRGLSCGSKFLAQLGACCTIKRLVHVFVETRVIDIELGHWQARHTSKSALQKALQRVTVLCWELLEYDERYLQPARMYDDG